MREENLQIVVGERGRGYEGRGEERGGVGMRREKWEGGGSDLNKG